MGFIRGKPVTVLKSAPLRDPVEYRILDSNVSLRRSEASLIEVVVTSTYAKIGHVDRAQRIDNWARILFPVAFVVLAVQSLGGYF